MKALWLALCLTGPAAAADFPFADDGALANALAGSRWHLVSTARYTLENVTVHMDRSEHGYDLALDPLLHDARLDDLRLELTLEPVPYPETYVIPIGRSRVSLPYPDFSQEPCAGAGLSMLRGTGQTRLERRMATTTLELWVASPERLIGMVRTERTDAFNHLRGQFEMVEATPLQ